MGCQSRNLAVISNIDYLVTAILSYSAFRYPSTMRDVQFDGSIESGYICSGLSAWDDFFYHGKISLLCGIQLFTTMHTGPVCFNLNETANITYSAIDWEFGIVNINKYAFWSVINFKLGWAFRAGSFGRFHINGMITTEWAFQFGSYLKHLLSCYIPPEPVSVFLGSYIEVYIICI